MHVRGHTDRSCVSTRVSSTVPADGQESGVHTELALWRDSGEHTEGGLGLKYRNIQVMCIVLLKLNTKSKQKHICIIQWYCNIKKNNIMCDVMKWGNRKYIHTYRNTKNSK